MSSSTTDATTTEEPPLAECEVGELRVGLVAQSRTINADIKASPEAGSASHELDCTVVSVDQAAMVVTIEMDCAPPAGTETTPWTLTLDVPESFVAPFEKSAELEVTFDHSWGFEVGGGQQIHVDIDGSPLLLASRAEADGGLVGHCGPGEELYEDQTRSFFAPLGLEITRGTCDPISQLRLDFEVGTETAFAYAGQDVAIGESGWSVAVGSAICESQEDDPEVNGSDRWSLDVIAWQ